MNIHLNAARKAALACAAASVLIATLCLVKTNSLTMMAFFSVGIPLHALGILIYLYDLAIVSRERERAR